MKITEILGTFIQKVCDTISIGTLVGTLIGWLPSIAAALTIVWTLIRIWEMQTVRKLLGRDNEDSK